MSKIAKISEDTKKLIQDKTVANLPDNPSAKGWSAEQIKGAFYKAITDEKSSVLSEMDRIVEEINEVFDMKEFEGDTRYAVGDIVRYNGSIYELKKLATLYPPAPPDLDYWEELLPFSAKQDKLPENDGSSSHRVFVAAPQGFKDSDGNEVKYHLKRVAGYNGTGKSSSNGDIGIVTKANRNNKIEEGLISENDGAYENYIEHDEFTDISIACRDKDGRLVVEDGTKSFHAVNKRQLDAAKIEAANLVTPSKIVTYESGAEGKTGWYRIAKTNLGGKSCSSIFKITVQCKGGHWSDLIITAAQCFDNTPQLSVISHQRRGDVAISYIRIVYDTNTDNTDGIIYTKTPSYLEVHISKPLMQIAVSMLGNTAALADTSVNVREEWELTDISLTENLETDFKKYTKSATDTVWADITAKSEDINALPTQIKTTKTYVDNSISNLHSVLMGSMALLNGKQTKHVSLYDYLIEPNNYNREALYVFMQNLLEVQIPEIYLSIEDTGMYIPVKVIPRKIPSWDTPVECVYIPWNEMWSGEIQELNIENIAIFFKEETCSFGISIKGSCNYFIEFWVPNDEGDEDLITISGTRDIDEIFYTSDVSCEVILSEEVAQYLPSTYSLRGGNELTEFEQETLEMLNNTQ